MNVKLNDNSSTSKNLLTGAEEYTDSISAEPASNESLGYGIKQSYGEAPVMLDLWGMRSTPSSPSLPGSRLLGVVASDRVLSMDQIELFNVYTECK